MEKTLGDRIRIVRKLNGLTMEAFGSKFDVSLSVVKNWEYDRVVPNSMAIRAICSTFHVSESWLRTGEGDMHAAITQREELAVLMGRFLAQNPESAKRIIIQALLECDDTAFFEKCVALAESIVQHHDALKSEEES